MRISSGLWRTSGGAPLFIIGLCALLLVGCGSGAGNDDSSTPAPDNVAVAEPTPTPVAISLTRVVWTTTIDPETRAPQDEVTTFETTAPVIIAAVEVGSMPAGAQLTATWLIDGVEVPAATMQITTDTTVKHGWATFQFTREEGRRFPLGSLEVHVTASDGSSVTGSVNIVLP